MEIIVANKIYIQNIPNIVAKTLAEALTVTNPVYHVMLRKNPRACYGISKEWKYYEWDKANKTFSMHRGNLNRLLKYLTANKIVFDLTYKLVSNKLRKEFVSSNLKLRDYQKKIFENFNPTKPEQRQGIFKLQTAWGKSILALKIIEMIQQSTLIIVPRVSLVGQFRDELKKWYNYEAGIIQGAATHIKPITVASVATLKNRDLSKLSDKFACIIADEASCYVSDKSVALFEMFRPKYLYAMSATPYRSKADGKSAVINFLFGGIIMEDELPQAKPIVEVINTNVDIEVEEYADMVKEQINNEKRNQLILQKLQSEVSGFRKILVLTKRVAHYKALKKALQTYYPRDLKIYEISSDDSQAERAALLKGFKEGNIEYNIIFGTYSMLGIGVDIISLDTLFLAGDCKSNVLTIQSVGRILRLFAGKPNPKIIDFHDNKNPIFHRQFLERRKVYDEMGWSII